MIHSRIWKLAHIYKSVTQNFRSGQVRIINTGSLLIASAVWQIMSNVSYCGWTTTTWIRWVSVHPSNGNRTMQIHKECKLVHWLRSTTENRLKLSSTHLRSHYCLGEVQLATGGVRSSLYFPWECLFREPSRNCGKSLSERIAQCLRIEWGGYLNLRRVTDVFDYCVALLRIHVHGGRFSFIGKSLRKLLKDFLMRLESSLEKWKEMERK